MRRQDREVTDRQEILNIMKGCQVCRLAFFDAEYPYLVPMNFGMVTAGQEIRLYFHGAKEGKKMELLQKNDHVAFSMDCGQAPRMAHPYCKSTMAYESVCGNGRLTVVEGEEKRLGLQALLEQMGVSAAAFPADAVDKTTVLRLTVDEIWGKRHE